mgnify:CR=1 FL=1
MHGDFEILNPFPSLPPPLSLSHRHPAGIRNIGILSHNVEAFEQSLVYSSYVNKSGLAYPSWYCSIALT